MRIDSHYFKVATAMQLSGIEVCYRNNSMTRYTMKKITYHKSIKAKGNAKGGLIDGHELAIAQDLSRNGMPKELVE